MLVSYMKLIACILALVSFLAAQTAAPPSASPEDPLAQARRLSQAGKYDDAITQLQDAGAKNPQLKGLAHELGLAYYRKGDYLKAIGSLTEATTENPGDNEGVQLLGISYYLAGKPVRAIPLLEKVQTWYPSANVDASYMLGICYLQTQDYDHARGAFAKMFAVPADSAASYLLTARMLLRQQFDPVAEQYALKAVAIDPKMPRAHALLGEIYTSTSKIPQAIAEFQKELAINPGDATTYYKLADAYSRDQKFDDAERFLQRSIWLDSTSTGPFILMGKVLAKKGEPELAARALQHALSMDPNNSMTHYLLGQAYRDLGKKDDAASEFKAAEQLKGVQDAR
jgi:tetratricopeptide (TPR) repeat protein